MSYHPDDYDLELSRELERRLDRDEEREPRRVHRPRRRPRYISGLMFRPIAANDAASTTELRNAS